MRKWKWTGMDPSDALEQVSENAALKAKFGCYFTEPDGYTNVGWFAWFGSQDEMLDFLLEVEPFQFSADEDSIDEFRKSLRPVLARVAKEGLSEKVLSKVDALFEESVLWWGTVQQLGSDQTEIPKRMRASFREREDAWEIPDKEPVDPISPREAKKWRRFLAEYVEA